MQHRWIFSIEKEEVYEIHNNKIYRYFTIKNKVLTFTLNLDSKESFSTLPQDSIPISFMRGNYIFLHKEFAHSTPSLIKLNSFQQYIMTLPNWKKSLIKNYNEDNVNSSLVAAIQLQQKLIIASDGSKSKKVSEGVWIIVDITGKTLISGTNLDFGNIQHIHSRCAEIYGVLSVFTFLHEYSKYYMLTFKSKIEYYCDNIEVVHKINTLSNNRNSFNKQHKTTNHDAVIQLKECFSRQRTSRQEKEMGTSYHP